MTIAVPRSGCFITINDGISTNPMGIIIEWNFSKKNILSLSIPKEMDIMIDLKKLNSNLNQPILLNGKIYNGGLKGPLTLSYGDYTLSF